MELLGEIFIWIAGSAAELIGVTVAENVDGKIKAKGSVSGIVIIILSVLLILGIIVGLGFASVYLFSQENTTAGFAAALVSFFFLVLFIAVTVNVIKIKNRNKIKNFMKEK